MACPWQSLAVQLLVARDFDGGFGGERVDDADADAVQAAGGGIGLALELPARVEGGHDDLERRLAGIFRMLLDRDAAAIVGDGEAIALSSVTSMRLAKPATASSIELSMTSAAR